MSKIVTKHIIKNAIETQASQPNQVDNQIDNQMNSQIGNDEGSHDGNDKPYLLADECPITQFMLLVGGKWKPIIICLLVKHSVMRFSQLHHVIAGISEKVLATQLKELETAQLISRNTYPQIPPKVEYSLTQKGHSILPIFQQIVVWSEQNLH